MNDILNPPAIVRPNEDLQALAHEINSEHALAEQASRKGLEHYRNVGKTLLKVKKACGHGHFGNWLRRNVKFTQQAATSYMRLAENWRKLKTAFNLSDAMRILADKKRTDERTSQPTKRKSQPPTEPASDSVLPPKESDDQGDSTLR